MRGLCSLHSLVRVCKGWFINRIYAAGVEPVHRRGQMSEKKRAPRVRAMMGAQLIYADGRMTALGIIRNLSNSGAKIAVDAAVPLPQEFELSIPQNGRRHRARLVWRNGTEIGVTFLGSGEAAAPAATESEIDALRSENALLKREIALLKTQIENYTSFGA